MAEVHRLSSEGKIRVFRIWLGEDNFHEIEVGAVVRIMIPGCGVVEIMRAAIMLDEIDGPNSGERGPSDVTERAGRPGVPENG